MKHDKPTKTAIAEPINRLVMHLVEILGHTTDLTPHHSLAKIIPAILEVAWGAYPDIAPSRGSKDALSRHKDAVRKAGGATRLRLVRLYLFAGDDRFPDSLFEHHKPHRFVERRVPRTTH